MAKVFFNISCNCDISKLGFLHIFGLGNNNAFLATSIGALATGIKFAKEWYLQRRHILELASEKGKSALLHLKTRIPAQYLFQSLTNIEKSIANNAAEAPKMVLKLSEILSYMLYDCNPDFVPLTKELAAVKEYILLEQITAKDSAAIELKTYGDVTDKAIVPAMLLSFLQHCFLLLSRKQIDATSIFTEIGTDDSKLHFLLSIRFCKENITALEWNEVIADMQLKLNKFYPGKHHLKVSHTEEETLIEFSVILNKIAEPVTIANEQILTHTYETV